MHLNNTKVWIYQSSRLLSDAEVKQISKDLATFIKNWNAHGSLLTSSFEIKHHFFIILMVDESVTSASGCSIDSSIRIIKQIEEKYNLDLFNRFNTVWRNEGLLEISNKNEFQELVSSKKIKPETIVYNNTVLNLKDLEKNWEIPFKESWHSRFFKTI